MQGPEPFLEAQHIRVASIVNPARSAVVDSTMRLFVGHDLFYFSNRTERAAFQRDPLKFCRRLSDPVTLVRFQPKRGSPHFVYHGRPYYFRSDSTFAAFRRLISKLMSH